ncbi:MAG: transposase, partial [Magnetococcales bacterium]|nr:transposase [Magnetococcales bacterium]
MGERKKRVLRLNFDRQVKVEFHGTKVTTDAGLLLYRELDDVLGLTSMSEKRLIEKRQGKNTTLSLLTQFRQSVFSRLAGYEDTNDADRLRIDPAMKKITSEKKSDRVGASTSQMGRFETDGLTLPKNLAALTDLSGQWIDRFNDRSELKHVILDIDSSESPTHGKQEGTAFNGHFGKNCYHPLFLFNS